MFKRMLRIIVVLIALLAFATPALALGTPGTNYVDTAYTGTETGSSTQPFNTLEEAVAAAQANPYGGYIYTKVNGVFTYYGYIATVYPPDTGSPIAGPALFALLALVSLGLIVGGWFLLRRSRARAQLA